VYDFEVPTNCQRWTNYHPGGCLLPPYSDHAHFTHPVAKPWQEEAPERPHNHTTTTVTSAVDLWWYTLYDLEELHPSIIRLEQLLPHYNKELQQSRLVID
jgi:hypothetical protein